MLCSELYKAKQLLPANMKPKRGDAIFIRYLESGPVPSRAELPAAVSVLVC